MVEDASFRCKGVLLSRAGQPSSGNSREHVHCQNSTSGWVRWGGVGLAAVGRGGLGLGAKVSPAFPRCFSALQAQAAVHSGRLSTYRTCPL